MKLIEEKKNNIYEKKGEIIAKKVQNCYGIGGPPHRFDCMPFCKSINEKKDTLYFIFILIILPSPPANSKSWTRQAGRKGYSSNNNNNNKTFLLRKFHKMFKGA